MSNYKLIYRFSTQELTEFMDRITAELEIKKSATLPKKTPGKASPSDLQEISKTTFAIKS